MSHHKPTPLVVAVTGAARLMLTLLEHSIRKLGGTYAMEDTDSMAIVATKRGGMIPRVGGRNGIIKALSWKQVKNLSNQFIALNPYDRSAVPGSILKIEDDNFDDPQRQTNQRQIYCLAISAKRYALFLLDKHGNPVLLRKAVNNNEDRWSEHGLGHLLNPTDPESEDREWIAQAWVRIIRKAMGMRTQKSSFDHQPAISRTSITSPAVLRPLEKLNEGKSYFDKIKPFNFLITCHVKPFGHPPGVDVAHFHLIAPYETDSQQWLRMIWTDQYSGNDYPRINDFLQQLFSGETQTYSNEALITLLTNKVIADERLRAMFKEDYVLYATKERLIELLYGIGFLGFKRTAKAPLEFVITNPDPGSQVLYRAHEYQIHPAYRQYLNLKG
jgi:hypothetical protein